MEVELDDLPSSHLAVPIYSLRSCKYKSNMIRGERSRCFYTDFNVVVMVMAL